MITSLDQLTPTARACAQGWVDASVASLPRGLRASVREDLVLGLCDALDPDATPDQVADAIDAIGPLEGGQARDLRVGRFLGIPYDLRTPTGERIRDALWDPADPTLWRPRAFGAGWDLNLGALAVRLGFIEPDAEDEPFASTPHEAFTVAATGPLVLTAAVVAHYVVRGRSLDDRLPSHWDLAGTPDRTVPTPAAAVLDVAASVVASALAVSAARSRLHAPVRAGRLALASGVGAVSAVLTAVRPTRGGWWVGPLIVSAAVGAPGATLLGLALAGRGAERRRDLGVAQ